jgi:membrane protease subunit HflK
MAWNESGNDKDPWGGNRQQQPGDLDKIVRDWQRKLKRFLGGGGGSGGSGGGEASAAGFALIGVVLLVVWAATGLYRVDEAERGLVLRFGKYVDTTDPGLHWHLPYPIETVEVVNAAVIDKFEQNIQMLTADENFVVIDLVVQFRRTDPQKYQFNVRDPDDTLSDVSESAIREAVGTNKLDFTLLGNRDEIAQQTKSLVQNALDSYEAGIEVVAINLQQVEFPDQVQDAVQDAVRAREEKQQSQLEAQTYENQVIPEARGAGERMKEAAEAYKAQVTIDAEGDAARFNSLLAEYQAAPRVTRERLYIEAIENVYQNSTKVFIDSEGNGNLLYLPIDKLTERARAGSPSNEMGNSRRSSVEVTRSGNADNDSDSRSRRTRSQ